MHKQAWVLKTCMHADPVHVSSEGKYAWECLLQYTLEGCVVFHSKEFFSECDPYRHVEKRDIFAFPSHGSPCLGIS